MNLDPSITARIVVFPFMASLSNINEQYASRETHQNPSSAHRTPTYSNVKSRKNHEQPKRLRTREKALELISKPQDRYVSINTE